MERLYGLPLLYQIRDAIKPVSPPDNVVIVTPYSERILGEADVLTGWKRSRHSEALEKLYQLEADVVAIDIYFRDRQPEDSVLAQTIASSTTTILNQSLRTVQLTNSGATVNILRNPADSLAHATQQLAPAVLPAISVRADYFGIFHQILYNKNAHHCYGYPSDSDLENGKLEQLGPELGVVLAPTLPMAVLENLVVRQNGFSSLGIDPDLLNVDQSGNCTQLRAIREAVYKNAPILETQLPASQFSRTTQNWLRILKQSVKQNDFGSPNPSILMNYFGPPGSFTSLDYSELDTLFAAITSTDRQNPLKNAIVFLGGSYASAAEQKKDGFVTVYSSRDEPMAGVEVTATAFANLYLNNYLRPVPIGIAMVLSALCGLIITAGSLGGRTTYMLLASGTSICLILLIASFEFITNSRVIPIAIPLLSIIALTLLAGVDHFMRRRGELDSAVASLRLFVPEFISKQIDKGNQFDTNNAICMVTDVRNFTQIGSRLPANQLHELNQIYFAQMFNTATQYGANVIKTYGDSMTAIWLTNDDGNYAKSIHAGLKIIADFEQQIPKSGGVMFSTRIGLSHGPVTIGYVGNDNQRTLEITGATVYVASRLEQLNKILGSSLLATASFAKHVDHSLVQRYGEHQLKGIDYAVEVVGFNQGQEKSIVAPNG